MVWSRESEAERPPLSVILPRLYLGAESDVTQDRLASLGISYVLSVSRCSPQPHFLPRSRYLRIPIDDSLWDDLLPWIPQALHFIDAAMSSGASVLVHCAAGISRSPALAVAYIMYSLGMDLDHAYRFVKERRPSISPNFNFLGQLQHFQGTLKQRAPDGGVSPPPPATTTTTTTATAATTPGVGAGDAEPAGRDTLRQRHPDGGAPGPGEPADPPPRPLKLQLPASTTSLLEKRKGLTLSLTPVGVGPPSPPKTVHGEGPDARKTRGSTGSLGERGPAPRGGAGARAPEPAPLSPFSFTLNRLLGWGERLLLGGVFVHPVRMGQPALPYRC